MIKTFRHKGLSELFETGSSSKVGVRYRTRALLCLDLLEQAESLAELDIPSFAFHRLQGKPVRYSLKVNGNFRITFGWQKGAIDIDLEDYH